MKGVIITNLIVLLGFGINYGQYALHHYFQQSELQQSQQLNPAFFQTEQKHSLALSGLFIGLDQDGPSYYDIFRAGGNNVIHIPSILNNLEQQNYLKADTELTSFHYVRSAESHYFSIGHSIRLSAFLNFPFELVDILAQGNYNYIGEAVEIGPEIHLNTFHQVSLGYGRKMDRLSFGGKLKLLSGIQDLATVENSLSLYTDPEFYQWNIQADYTINASSILSVDSLGGQQFDLNPLRIIHAGQLNPGFALDLGISYSFDNMRIGGSILDLGMIRWNLNPVQVSSMAEVTFEGLSITDILNDTIQIVDSINSVLNFEIEEERYVRNLPTVFTVGGSYFKNNWELGAMYYHQIYRGYHFPSFAFNVKRSFYKKHSIALQYAYRQSNPVNIGAAFVTSLGPVQLYLGTDNILSAFRFYRIPSSNIRFGVNIRIDHKKA